MIRFEIKWQGLDVLPYEKLMKKASAWLLRYVQKIFRTHGENSWAYTRSGRRATLSGIARTLSSGYTDRTAYVKALYTIHQHGGRMVKTERQTRFFWAKYYETKKKEYKWMALTKQPLRFPERMYMYIRERALNELSEEIGLTLTNEIIVRKQER